MNTSNIPIPDDADLRTSWPAIQRAAAAARKTAIDTNTSLVVMQDGKIVRIPAETLRKQAQDEPHRQIEIGLIPPHP